MPRMVTSNGLRLAVDVAPSPEPGAVLMVHATGFCKETWQPVIERLPPVTVITLDQRGHGGSDVDDPPFDWWDLASDVLAVQRAVGPGGPLIGVGHSSGGAALAMAEISAPATFAALVLVEPIVFPGPYGRNDEHPLVTGALRRRRTFPSLEEARRAFAGRGPFAHWTEEALDQYVDFGTVPDGEHRRLTCVPEVEAEFYRSATAHGAWERLDEIDCPVTVVVGEHSDSHPRQFAEALTARFPRSRLVVVPEATHFVPMERPDVVAGVVESVFRSLEA